MHDKKEHLEELSRLKEPASQAMVVACIDSDSLNMGITQENFFKSLLAMHTSELLFSVWVQVDLDEHLEAPERT